MFEECFQLTYDRRILQRRETMGSDGSISQMFLFCHSAFCMVLLSEVPKHSIFFLEVIAKATPRCHSRAVTNSELRWAALAWSEHFQKNVLGGLIGQFCF